MSTHTFFSFSQGLAKPIVAPKGTKREILQHVAEVEKSLCLTTEQYLENPKHWKRTEYEDIDDKLLCRIAESHNNWVRWLYERLGEWSKNPASDGEEITPSEAAEFWHALEMINVVPERWTKDYYRSRMEHLYEVMRGRESEGVTFDAKKKLTPEQCDAVMCLFSEFLDRNDLRLAVPKGHDSLSSSHDGGYIWCDKCCTAIGEGDEGDCRRRGCPVRALINGD